MNHAQKLEDVDFTAPGELVLTSLEIETKLSELTEISLWELAHTSAVEWWLTEYKAQPETSNLEKVRGYIEAIYHLCEVEAWEEAFKIFQTRLNTPTNEELSNQLNTWGYYQEHLDLCHRLFNKACDINFLISLNLGDTYALVGDYSAGVNYYIHCLDFARKSNNRELADLCCTGIASIYLKQGEYSKAIDILKPIVSAFLNSDEAKISFFTLYIVGQCFLYQRKYNEAIEYYRSCTSLSHQISNDLGKLFGQIGIASAFMGLGIFDRSISIFQDCFALSIQKQYYQMQSVILQNLGVSYLCIKEYSKAIEIFNNRLLLSDKVTDPPSEAESVRGLGIAYFELKEYNVAFSYLMRSLEASEKLGDFHLKMTSLYYLGKIYWANNNYIKSTELIERAIDISRNTLNDKKQVGFLLFDLGRVHLSAKKLDKAKECFKDSLAIAYLTEDIELRNKILPTFQTLIDA